jgi:hypothetical protein
LASNLATCIQAILGRQGVLAGKTCFEGRRCLHWEAALYTAACQREPPEYRVASKSIFKDCVTPECRTFYPLEYLLSKCSLFCFAGSLLQSASRLLSWRNPLVPCNLFRELPNMTHGATAITCLVHPHHLKSVQLWSGLLINLSDSILGLERLEGQPGGLQECITVLEHGLNRACHSVSSDSATRKTSNRA